MELLDHAGGKQAGIGRRTRWLIGLGVVLLAGGGAWVVKHPRPSAKMLAANSGQDQPVPTSPAPVLQTKPQTRPLVEWLGDIARQAELGLVAAPALDRKVVAIFPDEIPWQARLDSLTRGAGLSYRIDEGMIEIVTEAVSPGPSAPGGDIAQEQPAAESTLARFGPRHARATDLAKALTQVLRPRGVSAAADPSSNSLLLSGGPDGVAEARQLAAEMDQPPRRFLVEAQIVEMVTARRSDLGVQWRLDGDDFGAAVNFPTNAGDGREGEVTIATAGTISLKARISALEADGKARVVARPRVLVVEGRPALIESVRILRVRLPDSSSVVAGGEDTHASTPTRAVQEFPIGITLKVEPSLLGGDRVALRVTAKSSTLGEPLPPDDIPEELSRLVQADFFVAHGETAVLGGLARAANTRRHSGVPVLRDIPGLGVLFGRRARERDDEELLVLVTPYLLE